ncbi:hypothetical protein N7501_005894 [Penicillium viridicatum]|nr:hypothetical protein N7501_005894 [Penicillium viridicatum]
MSVDCTPPPLIPRLSDPRRIGASESQGKAKNGKKIGDGAMDHSGLSRLEPPGSRSLQIIENSASPASQIFRLFFPSSPCAQYSISPPGSN